MTAGEGVVRESTCNGSGVTDLGHQSSASMSSRSLAPRRAGTHSLLSEQINYLTNPNHNLTLNPGLSVVSALTTQQEHLPIHNLLGGLH